MGTFILLINAIDSIAALWHIICKGCGETAAIVNSGRGIGIRRIRAVWAERMLRLIYCFDIISFRLFLFP